MNHIINFLIAFSENFSKIINLLISISKSNFEIFYYFFGGIGLLLTGIGAFIGFKSYNSDFINKKLIRDIALLRKIYPSAKHRKKFLLIRFDDTRPVYIADLNAMTKRWITSSTNLYSLGYNFKMVDEVDKITFDLYKTEEPI